MADWSKDIVVNLIEIYVDQQAPAILWAAWSGESYYCYVLRGMDSEGLRSNPIHHNKCGTCCHWLRHCWTYVSYNCNYSLGSCQRDTREVLAHDFV